MIVLRPEALLAALTIEAAVGYPGWLFARIGHPVTWCGAMIAVLETMWNGGRARRGKGVLLLVVVVGVTGGSAYVVQAFAPVWLVVGLATTGLAQRSLYDHARRVERPLATGDLPAARGAVAMIVGRDVDTLDEAGVATAAIESVAESFCDGVVAPAFWFLIAGLPGLAICKAINTADSMIGHKDDRYRAFGWAAARADDIVNVVPARIAGALICLVGAGGVGTMLRDAAKHASPNGGWPEAAMAGVLRRRLGGTVSYDGEPADRAVLGVGPAPDADDLTRALRLYCAACLALWVGAGAIAWAR